MKKSTLALSVAAAIGSFGLVGSAFAVGQLGVGQIYMSSTKSLQALPLGVDTAYTKAAVLVPVRAATKMELNPDGIGHQLIVPYFSVQNDNNTLLNIANTDTINAKIVKVRFRGAANSDDLFDFQLLLSPGDIWAAGLAQDKTTGKAKLTVYGDSSCTVPNTVRKNISIDPADVWGKNVVDTGGSLFLTKRVDTTGADLGANQTREGYIEIINVADVPPNAYNNASAAAKATTLYGTIKHVAGKAPCNDDVINAALMRDYATTDDANKATSPEFVPVANAPQYAYSMVAPSGGLTADWVIMNQTSVAAWSGLATALEARDDTGTRALGYLSFWPQASSVTLGSDGNLIGAPRQAASDADLSARNVTADPLFVTKTVTIQPYDLPDLSTPYLDADKFRLNDNLTTKAPAHGRIDDLSEKLGVSSITSQYVTKQIAGVTDILFTQPTRRYSVGVDYAKFALVFRNSDYLNGNLADIGEIISPATTFDFKLNNISGKGSKKYNSKNLSLSATARQACLNTVQVASYLDREEQTEPGVFVVSPGSSPVFSLCGEVGVLSINTTTAESSAVSASVVRNSWTPPPGGVYDLGTLTFVTSSAATGLMPILSNTFIRVQNTEKKTNYGFSMTGKVTR